jgi:hypothetical protein
MDEITFGLVVAGVITVMLMWLYSIATEPIPNDTGEEENG